MDESDRIFLRRHAAGFSKLAEAHLPWVMDGMEPQNRRSVQARRHTLVAGRARGISHADLAGFFRLDRTTVWKALADDPEALLMPMAGRDGK